MCKGSYSYFPNFQLHLHLQRPLPTMDPGWKAVQDAKQKLKGKRLGEEAKRAATNAVVGKKFQETVAASCNTVGAEALAALNSQGYYIKDDFLGQEACEFMRAEAEAFHTAV